MSVLNHREPSGCFDNHLGTPLRMDPVAKELWLAALESDAHEQATGKLFRRETDGFCCLGLFAKVQGCQFEPTLRRELDVETDDIKVLGTDEYGDPWDVNESELLLQRYADQFGISHFAQNVLSRLNDGTTTTIYKSDSEYSLKVAFWRQMKCSSMLANETDTAITFHPEPHSFGEIAAVIRKHF